MAGIWDIIEMDSKKLNVARKRGRPRKFDEEQVLDAAINLFQIHGYGGISLDDLAKETGLNKPSLYGAFGNKQQLFDRCVEHHWSKAGAVYLSGLFAGGTLEEDLRSYFNVYIDYITNKDRGGCVVVVALPIEVTQDERLLWRYDSVLQQSDQSIIARLKKGQKAGEVSETTDLEKLSRVVIDASFGINLRARSSATVSELKEQADYFVDMVVCMIEADKLR